MNDTSTRLIPAQRRSAIQEYLSIHEFARSSTLSELMGVSEATIRRDLEWLERHGSIERTHGGAILSQRMRMEPAFNKSIKVHPLEKRWIGRAAAQLVESGDTIFLNFGTTTAQVVSHLRERTDLTNVTIITNNVSAAMEAGDSHLEVVLVGGYYRSHSNSVAGHFAARILSKVFANKAFIGVDGISPKIGCTTPASAEAEVSRLMIESTRGQVIVVADHSKWGVVSNFLVAPLNQIDTLIIDRGISKKALSVLEDQAVQVIIAGPKPREED